MGTRDLVHSKRSALPTSTAVPQRSGSLIAVRRRAPEPAASVPTLVQDTLQTPGQPLEASLRAAAEQRLGFDFSHVRIHTDSRAEASAEALRAHAYTVGSHIVFAPGQYAPSSTRGQEVLRHELAHVMQQQTPAPTGYSGGPLALGAVDARHERQAAQLAQATSPAVARAHLAGSPPLPSYVVARLANDAESDDEERAYALERLIQQARREGRPILAPRAPSAVGPLPHHAGALASATPLQSQPEAAMSEPSPPEEEAMSVDPNAPTEAEETARQSLPAAHLQSIDALYTEALRLLPPEAASSLLPITAEEVANTRGDGPTDYIGDAVSWMFHTLKRFIPIRLAKVFYYLSKLRDELPEVAKRAAEPGKYWADFRKLYGFGSNTADAARGTRSFKRIDNLTMRGSKLLAAMFKKYPWAEFAAVNVRVVGGWLTADFKTIVRHIFWTKRREMIPYMEKVAQGLAEQWVWKILASGQHDAEAIRAVVSEGLDVALRQGAFNAPVTAAKSAIEATKVGSAATEAEKAAAEATRLKPAQVAAKEVENVAEGAAAAAQKGIQRPGRVKSATGWIIRKGAQIEKAAMSAAEHVGSSVARPILQTLFFNEMENSAVEVLGKHLSKEESKLAADLAKEITTKAVQKAIHKIVAAGAIASGAYTTMKAAEAFSEGKTLLGAVKTAHAVTDFAGVVPGVGVAISFAGDVVFLTLEWYVEDDAVQAYVRSKLNSASWSIQEKITLPIWHTLLGSELANRLRF